MSRLVKWLLDAIVDSVRFWWLIIRRSIVAPAKLIKGQVTMVVVIETVLVVSTLLESSGVIASIQWLPAVLLNAIRILSVFGVICIVIWVIGLLYQPAKLYKGMGGFIKNPFKITLPKKDEDHDAAGGKWPHIKVESRSPTEGIEKCCLELVEICEEGKSPREFEQQNLSWSWREGENRNEKKTIECNLYRWCDLVRTHPNQVADIATFEVWYGGESQAMRIVPGKYNLKINAHGIWQNVPVAYTYLATLNFVSKSEIKIGSIELIGKVGEKQKAKDTIPAPAPRAAA
jgi:hypothetical protein